MPAQYEAMRDHFIREGLRESLAKRKAAKIYNSKHPGAPVTGKHKLTDNRDNRDNTGGRD